METWIEVDFDTESGVKGTLSGLMFALPFRILSTYEVEDNAKLEGEEEEEEEGEGTEEEVVEFEYVAEEVLE